MAQNFSVTSLSHGLPHEAQRLLVLKSCVHGTVAKIRQSPKFSHRLLNVQPNAHGKAQTLPGDQSVPRLQYATNSSLAKPFQTEPQRSPPRIARSGTGGPCISQPRSAHPAAQPPPALQHPSLLACTSTQCDSLSKGDGAATPGSLSPGHLPSTPALQTPRWVILAMGDAGYGPALPQLPQLPFERHRHKLQ